MEIVRVGWPGIGCGLTNGVHLTGVPSRTRCSSAGPIVPLAVDAFVVLRGSNALDVGLPWHHGSVRGFLVGLRDEAREAHEQEPGEQHPRWRERVGAHRSVSDLVPKIPAKLRVAKYILGELAVSRSQNSGRGLRTE